MGVKVDVGLVHRWGKVASLMASPSPRSTLAVAVSVIAAMLVIVGRPLAVAAKEVDVYFGVGNFFHLQHELVLKEALDLTRREGDITAVAGYAGGTKVGGLDRVCYSGLAGAP